MVDNYDERLKDQVERITYRVTEDATEKLMLWVKWIAGIFAIALALVGITSYQTFQSTVSDQVKQFVNTELDSIEGTIHKRKREVMTGVEELQILQAEARANLASTQSNITSLRKSAEKLSSKLESDVKAITADLKAVRTSVLNQKEALQGVVDNIEQIKREGAEYVSALKSETEKKARETLTHLESVKERADKKLSGLDTQVKGAEKELAQKTQEFAEKMSDYNNRLQQRYRTFSETIDEALKDVEQKRSELNRQSERLREEKEKEEKPALDPVAPKEIGSQVYSILYDEKNVYLRFIQDINDFSKSIMPTDPIPPISFKEPKDKRCWGNWNTDTKIYEVNPHEMSKSGRAEFVALMSRFWAKNYKRCGAKTAGCNEHARGDEPFWDYFRYSVVDYILYSQGGEIVDVVDVQTKRPLFRALRRLGELLKEDKDLSAKLALKLLESFECDWTRSVIPQKIRKVNSELPNPIATEVVDEALKILNGDKPHVPGKRKPTSVSFEAPSILDVLIKKSGPKRIQNQNGGLSRLARESG